MSKELDQRVDNFYNQKPILQRLDNQYIINTDHQIKVMPMTGKISSVSQPVSISWHNINVFSKPSTGIRLPFRKKDDSSVHILKNGIKLIKLANFCLIIINVI